MSFREVFVAFGSLVVSAACVVYLGILLFSLGPSHLSRGTNLLHAIATPLSTCAVVTASLAFGAAIVWRGPSWLLGLVAAIPYFIVCGMLLFESRTDGVLFWSSAGVLTFLFYVAAIFLVRLTHRNNVA